MGQREGAELRERFGTPEAILEVMQEVRLALRALLVAAGLNPTKVRETARELGIDRNLAWRTTRLVNADDILAATQNIPTLNHVEKICVACNKQGAPKELLEKARAAVINFERVVEECAGNREYFEAMISGFVHDDVTQRQENARKLAFLSNLALWGVQALVDFKTAFYAPSADDPGTLDIVKLGGLVSFRRSRPLEWPIHRVQSYSEDGNVLEYEWVPLFKSDRLPSSPPVVEKFSSDPLPELIQVKTDYGKRYDLPVGEFGNVGAITCVFASHLVSADSRWRTENVEHYLAIMNDLYTPSELVVQDIFLHRDLGIDETPDAMVLDRLSMPRGYNPEIDDQHRMPLSSKVLRISASPAGCHLTRFPGYSELIQAAFERLGWSHEEFLGNRFMLSYPPVPSAVVTRSRLPDRPKS